MDPMGYDRCLGTVRIDVHPSHAATPPATFERAGPGTSPGAIEIVLGMWMWPIMVYQKYVKCYHYILSIL